jgi:clan AA aspartic protease (TIGR02281 family)
MKNIGGVSIIPCKVNGLNLNFIFDTGASNVSISMTEASFMFKNGYLEKSDIIGSSNFLDANGNINEGVLINLKEIEIGTKKIFNVRANVIKNNKAPLLLGQSAIKKLGELKIDLQNNTLEIFSGDNTNSQLNTNTKNDIVSNNPIIGLTKKIGNIEVAQFDLSNLYTWIDAKKACDELGSGWRLPTKDELNTLYKNKSIIGGFKDFPYWSSTEYDSNQAWYQIFDNGRQVYYQKAQFPVYVRAVRSF